MIKVKKKLLSYNLRTFPHMTELVKDALKQRWHADPKKSKMCDIIDSSDQINQPNV